MLGLPAMAVSAGSLDPTRDQWDDTAYDFGPVAGFAARLTPPLLEGRTPPGVILNVNAPGVPATRIAGARTTRLGRRVYNDRLELLGEEAGRRRYAIYGTLPSYRREPGTDFAAMEDRVISVTPIHFDLTDVAGIGALDELGLPEPVEGGARP